MATFVARVSPLWRTAGTLGTYAYGGEGELAIPDGDGTLICPGLGANVPGQRNFSLTWPALGNPFVFSLVDDSFSPPVLAGLRVLWSK